MEKRLPTRNLVRLNWLLAVVMSATVFLFLLQVKTEPHKLLFTTMTGIAIVLIGYANIGILIILKRRPGIATNQFKRYRYLLSYAASAATYLALWPVFARLSGESWSYLDLTLFATFISSGALVNTMIVFLHDVIILQTDKAQSDLELSRLKTAHAEAAHLLLKQQVHPHFLFNALNTVKALYRKNPGAGDAYIVHLANFLRASVVNHASSVSTLEDELALLNDYVEMQKIRFGTALEYSIVLPGNLLKAFYLPTFSLQPLMENAIKHNELTQEAPLKVCIHARGDWITVSNNLQKKNVPVSSASHGLANLTERYRLWSGDEVIIKEDQNSFSVSIKLLTDAYSDYRG